MPAPNGTLLPTDFALKSTNQHSFYFSGWKSWEHGEASLNVLSLELSPCLFGMQDLQIHLFKDFPTTLWFWGCGGAEAHKSTQGAFCISGDPTAPSPKL